jgi:HAD superfamily hydrolase (TIGR01509 family)
MALLRAVLWDMDGTLIDSEPVWHEGEMQIAQEHGGFWNDDIAWENSGKPVVEVAKHMIELGTQLSVEEISKAMIDYVYQREIEQIPWTTGVVDVLRSLASDGVPSVLVTQSPREMAENLVSQAPKGAFVGYVSGSDGLPQKPDPAPYLAAGRLLGIEPEDMSRCIAIEDSMPGLRSAATSGATTLAQNAFNRADTTQGPQFAMVHGYDGMNARVLEEYVRQRIG